MADGRSSRLVPRPSVFVFHSHFFRSGIALQLVLHLPLPVDYILPFFHIPLFQLENEGFISLRCHHLVGCLRVCYSPGLPTEQ